jgi:hypothetical protein
MKFGINMKYKYSYMLCKETCSLQFIDRKLQICLLCKLQREFEASALNRPENGVSMFL